MDADTVATGRSRRTTAGNRMRELLEKAHQQDEEEMFAEVEDDEDFEAPQDVRDVYLEDFADTDDEVELDEEEEERQMRREERRKAKGKSKAYNPLAPKPAAKVRPTAVNVPVLADLPNPSSSSPASTSTPAPLPLPPSIDPNTMAPTTLVLAMRKHRRDLKRQNRNEARRSTMRASTLRTEQQALERQLAEKENPNRKGRKALHEGGEVRGVRKMTQDELIAEALEEEERNRQSLGEWVRREEERRELRRVGRKRVRGPRWTWVSRTAGGADGGKKLVEEVEIPPPVETQSQETPEAGPSTTGQPDSAPDASQSNAVDGNQPYTRNYLILSQIPGGLPAEMKVVFGDHVDWDEVEYIPARNRPINRRPTLCALTGIPARYRHPTTMIPYAFKEGYRVIEGLLADRYKWDHEGGWWAGAEEADMAEGVEGLDGWLEAVHGGWLGGKEVPVVDDVVSEQVMEVEAEPDEDPGEAVEVNKGKGKRKSEPSGAKGKKARASEAGSKSKGKAKSKGAP